MIERVLWSRPRTTLAVALLLTIHGALAVVSLLRENPTVDEVIHLPAGISYWQTGSFRLYHHNPPLVKLVAAWPAIRAGVVTAPLYPSSYWRDEPPNKSGFAHEFAALNARHYFDLFTRARLLMPLFSLVGALAVFFWSRALYGDGGGLLSLALWCVCPNILAHARLITTDVAATSLGVLATFTFWLYLRRPSWRRAGLAGLCLGLAQLTKFSLLLLYGIWPLLWVLHEILAAEPSGRWRRMGRTLGQGAGIVFISLLAINLGYGFEGFGRRLGDFNFVSGTLSCPRERPVFFQPRPRNHVEHRIQEYRVNRFRGTFLGQWPTPLPSEYVLGFDDQKLEADGIWSRFLVPPEIGDQMGTEGDQVTGYPVYLDGRLRDRSWWDYYLRALLYKVPEGTWVLLVLSWAVLAVSPRARPAWFDEMTLLIVPVVVLVLMSGFTNINLGLRYVLPIFPYLFIAAGKLVPWASGRRLAKAGVGLALLATAGATASIHPHYLAYFNVVSGGPRHGSAHLIDSNLDWGQDLVGLKRWADRHAPGEPIGVAYFGQINPNLFELRGQGLNWFLPPPRPGTMPILPPGQFPPRPPRPGLHAVSASLVRGLPWRVYDPSRWPPWEAKRDAFGYFRELTPFETIGYSIFLYRVTPADAERLARHWDRANPATR